MALANITLQQTMTWATYFVGNRLLALSSPGNEPALTSANMVIQVMLQPPFRWRWNRDSKTFPITSATTDYSIAIPTFGFIEKAYVNDGTKNTELQRTSTILAPDLASGRPNEIAPYLEDDTGNITFRFMPGKPDRNYDATVIFQKKPVLLTAPGDLWGIPDEYSFVYNWGFLALMYLFADSEKFGPANQKFLSGLLAISEGLSEQDKALFLSSWDFLTQNIIRNQGKSQQGIQDRQA